MPNRTEWESAMSRNNKNKSFLCDAIDPEYEKMVFECFRRQKFMKFIGAELLRVLPGFCTLQLKFREKMTHDPLCFHPGVVGALADSAGEFAALSLLPADSSLATADCKLNLLAPAQGDVLVAHAKVVKSGKPMTVCTSEIYVRKDRSQNLCAMALMTFIPG
jgi:uncharacterized protein (TIGR00369 family)